MAADVREDIFPGRARVRQAVLDAVADAPGRLSPHIVEGTISRLLQAPKISIRHAVRELVQEGRLAYASLGGSTFIETSFQRPTKVAERIWLCPLRTSPPKPIPSNAVVVRLHAGAAFGSGSHPTTRLALQGLEAAFSAREFKRALDIGTGTGVLAIAAALFGASYVVGIDIDPCARAEAAANVAENGVADRTVIKNASVGRLHGSFDLVLANLRPPTLSVLAERLGKLSCAGAVSVFSGFRPEEWPALATEFLDCGWTPIREAIESRWMAVTCVRFR